MKRLLPCLALALLGLTSRAAENFDEAVKRASADYDRQIRQAADELDRVRQKLTAAKAPLLQAKQAAEQRILALEREVLRLETADQTAGERRRKLGQDQDALRKTISYLNGATRDALRVHGDALAPGEALATTERIDTLLQSLEDAAANSPKPAAEALAFLTQRTTQALGGYVTPGKAVVAGSNEVRPGIIAVLGPSAWFLPDQGAPATLSKQAGTLVPAGQPLPGWDAIAAQAFFGGKAGRFTADPTGGKALRLEKTRGSVWHHIQTGGTMAYVILATGVIALLLIAQKIRDVAQLRLDPPAQVQEVLAAVARGDVSGAQHRLEQLKATTRELFATALRYRSLPQNLLEEHLQSWCHRQQMHFERHLSLLAVVATAAPLMGLLGTVSGMVNTFALMTVFGSGNAMKLSSGISEVLVATELGLVVAIPALVIHGFLSYRIRKGLSLLDHYAMDFVIALETSRVAAPDEDAAPASHEAAH